MVRVLVIDSYEPWRRLVALLLGVRWEIQIVGEAESGESGVQMAGRLKPDLIVLDIGLSDMSGIAAARAILTQLPKTKIIFLTQNTDPEIIHEALRLGAHGYVLKVTANQDLLAAFDSALFGRVFVSPAATEHDDDVPNT